MVGDDAVKTGRNEILNNHVRVHRGLDLILQVKGTQWIANRKKQGQIRVFEMSLWCEDV